MSNAEIPPQEKVRRLLRNLHARIVEHMEQMTTAQIKAVHVSYDAVGDRCAEYLAGKCPWDGPEIKTIQYPYPGAYRIDRESGDRTPFTIPWSYLIDEPDVMSLARDCLSIIVLGKGSGNG